MCIRDRRAVYGKPFSLTESAPFLSGYEHMHDRFHMPPDDMRNRIVIRKVGAQAEYPSSDQRQDEERLRDAPAE